MKELLPATAQGQANYASKVANKVLLLDKSGVSKLAKVPWGESCFLSHPCVSLRKRTLLAGIYSCIACASCLSLLEATVTMPSSERN